MNLLILDSIGTAELLLIGLVALIVFGPRRLPEMMHKVGKIMTEFRKTTGEFKKSWEKEVALDFEEEKNLLTQDVLENKEKSINSSETEKNSLVPEVRDLNKEEFNFEFSEEIQPFKQKESEETVETTNEKKGGEVDFVNGDINNKQNWL